MATDMVVGGVLGAAGGVIGKAVAPIAKTLAASVSNSVRTATAKAGGAVASAARKAGDAVKTVAKRATSTARSAGSKAASSADDALEGGACALMSFAADTRVLLADGTTKPIAEIEVGDEVLAADPVDGTQAGKPVEAVHVHDDALVDLVVDGAVLRTSEDYPFWSVTDQQFERADHLTPGEEVLTATGTTATIDGLDVANSRYAPAHNLTITDLHTYYVLAGNTATLVHNCGQAAEAAGGGARSVVASTDVVTTPSAMDGLTASQVDDLARNAGYEVLPGRAGAANPATRYYAPGTNRSVGFRVLPEGVTGQSGVKAGPYLRFFGGPNAGQRIPLEAL
ncbi:Hint domain-containing protein [Cellulomonas persica]|uniref:Hint domain-containing protein n=1 Tax=Cellulomonas persica TaxID=76861 RepID=A0A510UQW7_9CELL|nr:Hint domain-containing protein [Cellulomonas persica]GEK17052.1 hypothetical protein CPE01_07850 [Cellulomonas persica]